MFTEDVDVLKSGVVNVPPIMTLLAASGLYTFELVVEKDGAISSAFANSSNFTFSWQYNVQGVRRQQYGLNGMMFFYSDRHFYFTEDDGAHGRAPADKWNTPGVLLSGSVLSSGNTISWWGAKKHANYLVQKVSGVSGTYDVYHSIGYENYHVGITPHANRTFYIGAKTSSSFRVYFYTNASSPALSDTGFDFQITGNNYIT